MMPQHNTPNISVKAFGGVRQVDPSFDNVLQEVHGCFDRPTGILKKFNGKCLNTTGISGPVWSIGQLKFSDRLTNVRRVGTTVEAYSDYRSFPPWIVKKQSTTDPTPEPPVYITPPWSPTDFPTTGPKSPPSYPTPQPKTPTYQQPSQPVDWIRITCTPSSFNFNTDTGYLSGTSVLEALTSQLLTWSYVKVEWDKTTTWLTCSAGTNGSVYETSWDDGSMSVHQQNVTFTASSSVPYGTYSTIVKFTLMTYTGSDTYQPVVDGSGTPIAASCSINLINPTPPVYTGTINFYIDVWKNDGTLEVSTGAELMSPIEPLYWAGSAAGGQRQFYVDLRGGKREFYVNFTLTGASHTGTVSLGPLGEPVLTPTPYANKANTFVFNEGGGYWRYDDYVSIQIVKRL